MQEIMQFANTHPLLSLAWAALLVLVIFTTFKNMFSKVKTVSRGEATRQINRQDAIVVDVRSREDYRRGHISGSLNLVATDIKKGNIGELEKSKSQPVIVVCANGMSASEPAAQLSAMGFAQVSVLKEGLAGWNSDNLPLVQGK